MPWKKFQKSIMLDQIFRTTLNSGMERSAKRKNIIMQLQTMCETCWR
jgi:hypothetical protein